MSDETIETLATKAVVDTTLSLSESAGAKERQEGVIDRLAEPRILERFTDIGRREPQLFAKMHYYDQDIKAMEKWENDQINGGPSKEGEVWNGGDYVPPDMPEHLFTIDLQARVSKLGKLIGVFQKVSHLVEGSSGGGARGGFFGRRRG